MADVEQAYARLQHVWQAYATCLVTARAYVACIPKAYANSCCISHVYRWHTPSTALYATCISVAYARGLSQFLRYYIFFANTRTITCAFSLYSNVMLPALNTAPPFSGFIRPIYKPWPMAYLYWIPQKKEISFTLCSITAYIKPHCI